MGVAPAAVMNVDVHEPRPVGGVPRDEAGLLPRLAHGGVRGVLTAVDVAAGLQPQAEPLVPMQDHTSGTGHDCRGRDVHGVGLLIERVGQPRQLGPEPRERTGFTFVDREPPPQQAIEGLAVGGRRGAMQTSGPDDGSADRRHVDELGGLRRQVHPVAVNVDHHLPVLRADPHRDAGAEAVLPEKPHGLDIALEFLGDA